ncbi:MAG: hypothetical protein WCT32_05465 [Patescibacteria group bacterium]|jgi:hypothetical protein
MWRYRVSGILGIFVAIVPFLGLPGGIFRALLFFIGLTIGALGLGNASEDG